MRAAGCVFAEEEAGLLAAAAAGETLVGRRIAGEPLEQLLGWAEFDGRRVVVQPGVFVPRRRTERLVQTAADLVRVEPSRSGAEPRDVVVVDLCCGSGAVGLALVHRLGRVQLHAVDGDPTAVRCARANLASMGGQVYRGDLDAPLPARLLGRVDLLVANVPYVPTDKLRLLPREARLYEPREALDGGPDGLRVLRRVAQAAPRWLAPGGAVLMETSQDQASAALASLADAGLLARVRKADGTAVVIGTRIDTALRRRVDAPDALIDPLDFPALAALL